MRVSLPGNNALTDPNLDHYALYADQDNFLIKEFTRGTANIAAGGTLQIAHNLGYIPFFMVFYSIDANGTAWQGVPAYQNNGVSVPLNVATSDTGTLTITNNNGSSNPFQWFIFYDNFTKNAGSITSSKQTIRVSKQGQDVLNSNDPNAFIFHSDLNTFKIVSEGTVALNYTGGTAFQTLSWNHNANLGTPTAHMLFVKFPDGYTTIIPGHGLVYSYDSNWRAFGLQITPTQMSFSVAGTGNANFTGKFYVFEAILK